MGRDGEWGDVERECGGGSEEWRVGIEGSGGGGGVVGAPKSTCTCMCYMYICVGNG